DAEELGPDRGLMAYRALARTTDRERARRGLEYACPMRISHCYLLRGRTRSGESGTCRTSFQPGTYRQTWNRSKRRTTPNPDFARRPGGLVALAIQYGHLPTALVSEGYAARCRDGIHELIDIETVRAMADTVADFTDDLEAGGGVSGPAARRAIKTAARAPRFEGPVINATTARRLLGPAQRPAVARSGPLRRDAAGLPGAAAEHHDRDQSRRPLALPRPPSWTTHDPRNPGGSATTTTPPPSAPPRP
ncbi:hypothetical protein ACFZA6_31555, partial [Streptomyces sp. NPDC008240]